MLPPFIGATSGVSNSNLGSKLLISKLFCHYKNTTYNIILGIFISTIISLTYQTLTKLSTTHELIIGIPLLLVGYTLGKTFDR